MSDQERRTRYQDPTVRKTGSLLAAHRTNLGVSLLDVVQANSRAVPEHIRFAEKADGPAASVVESWYRSCLPAFLLVPEFTRMPSAARNQWYWNEHDSGLWSKAAETHRGIHWWWGLRKLTPPHGAWCWLCDELIHGCDVVTSLSAPARAAIMKHRAGHLTPATTDKKSDTRRRAA